MESIFDTTEIKNRVEEFFALYETTRGSTYDMCEAKIIHSRAVAANCKFIAESLGFDAYDTDLAWIIGELHDFARFGQIVVTHTFKDSAAFNHAHFGAALLFDHELIADLIPNYEEVSEEDRQVMKKAIYHHSDFHLPDGLTPREQTYCDLIRDADQLDIFRTIVESGWETIYGHSKEEILATSFSDAIVAAFHKHELADYSKRETLADFHLAHIALCFGLRSKAAHKRVVEQGYLRQMMDIEFTNPNVQQVFLGLKEEVREHVGLPKDEEIVTKAKHAATNIRKAKHAKKIAVIGGSGQIGNYLLPLLVDEGHEVVSICRGNQGYFRDAPEFAQVREVHLTRGQEDFEQAVAELGCDVVVDTICLNKDEAAAMATAMAGKVAHYIAIGSIWIHGPAVYTPTTEDESRTPMDAYGTGKLELTDYLMGLWRTEKFPATVVHPGHIIAPGHSNIVGPQANHNLDVFEALRDGRTVTLPNLGLETLQHVHAADIAGIINAAIRAGEPTFGQEYHAVAPHAITLRGFCKEVAALFGEEAHLEFVSLDEFDKLLSAQDAADTHEYIGHSPCCSAAKAERELGYVCRPVMEAVEEHLRAIGML